MLRRVTIDYDVHLPSNKTPFLFNPEKKNPSARHLLSLQIYFPGEVLPYNFHLRHLRLVKMLDLRYVQLTDCLLNEIGMLVHLRCLIIEMKSKALPRSFSNLCNLEILKVRSYGSNIVLSPVIWSLAKLRHVEIGNCSVFVSDIDKPTKLENLTTLRNLNLSSWVDSVDIFKRFSNLQTLDFSMDCSAEEQICFPRLDVFNKLERVQAVFLCSDWFTHVHQFDFYFPASLKQLKLNGFNLISDELSRIGTSTPNLQKLSLSGGRIKEWNMEQVTFHNLKSLKLDGVIFFEWQGIADESFPVLEELILHHCNYAKEIPERFGDIASLKSITVWSSPHLKESAIKIKEYVEELTGEDRLTLN